MGRTKTRRDSKDPWGVKPQNDSKSDRMKQLARSILRKEKSLHIEY
ncbi:hypothetical protein COLO4_05918 [Corchorus olitorius]|uniref:Uncharacterized protein n=1 Tax=Corchorus olitorius TaxID=93759 RepID=A0A1R3KPI1_9ROSI|nr:hypothetical protein COLO4_05918 [Corchorus olitorius]